MKDLSLTTHFDQLIQKTDPVVITVHSNPDGDAMGSGLALKQYLLKKGVNVQLIVPNKFPSFLSQLPGIEDAIVFDTHASVAKEYIYAASVLFSLDYNAPDRSGVLQEDLKKAGAKTRILMDHHPDPDLESFTHYFYDTNKSSTAELVFQFILEMGDKILIDKGIAKNIFVGIMTDTGSFSHSIHDPQTFRVVADLVETGIDAVEIHREIYHTFTENRLRLLGHAITNRMIILDDYRTAIIHLSKQDLNDFHFRIGDTEGIVNYPLSMEKIILAIMITEKKDLVRLSFRSKGSFSVNNLARKHFKGGGHRNAAGGNSEKNLKDTITHLLSVLPEYKTLLNEEADESLS